MSAHEQKQWPVPGRFREPRSSAHYRAAFFDLDGTLIIGQTQRLLVSFLFSKKKVSRRFLAGTFVWFAGYKLGLLHVTDEARAKGGELLRALPVDEGGRLLDEFTAEVMMPRLHAGASAALESHRRAGDRLVILSAALQPLVESLGRRLRVADCFGAPCEVEGGRYTGRLLGAGPHGQAKVKLAAELMDRWGLQPADCFAYADHENDIPLLRSVGHPVAVRPKPGLLRTAQAEGWRVLP